MLRKHGCLIPEARFQALDAASSKWEEVMRKAFEAKEAILPLQNAEVNNIRNTLENFGSEVAAFREEFLREAPFDPNTDATAAYASIDSFYEKRLKMEQAARELNNLETLFDMAKSVHKELKDTKEDLKTLKVTWGGNAHRRAEGNSHCAHDLTAAQSLGPVALIEGSLNLLSTPGLHLPSACTTAYCVLPPGSLGRQRLCEQLVRRMEGDLMGGDRYRFVTPSRQGDASTDARPV